MDKDGVVVRNIVNDMKEKAENADREKDKGMINENTGSSFLMNENGDLVLAPSKYVQYKMKYNEGQATETSMQSNTITNRKNIKTDEITINKHKFNNQFFELTDYKQYGNDPTSAIGNLTVCTTVLVKTWEPYLEKWVLIRRPARMALFSNMLPIADVPDTMNLTDENGNSATDVSDEIKEMRTYDKQQSIYK